MARAKRTRLQIIYAVMKSMLELEETIVSRIATCCNISFDVAFQVITNLKENGMVIEAEKKGPFFRSSRKQKTTYRLSESGLEFFRDYETAQATIAKIENPVVV